ncbi:MAG TPA: adenylate/guanylate cyclase domain-containing protein [Candidatus Nanoarchaeia archaeon]|nr:adenylate/guanylate cyclase domain-containing protein [Candidatus Nanoarchaeia archaeon]
MKSRVKPSVMIALGCFLVLSIFFSIGVLSNVNRQLTDNLYGGLNPLQNIVIISIDDKSIQEIGRWPWARSNFSAVLNKVSDARAIGIDVAFFEPSDAKDDMLLSQSLKGRTNVVLTAEYTDFALNGSDILGKNIMTPIVAQKETTLGYVNVITDDDGVTRATNLKIQGKYSGLMEEVYAIYKGNRFEDASSRFLINFVGSPKSFTYYPFIDVLRGNYSFKDKIVLIGATAPDLHDDYFVPTSSGKAMPGVEIHANILQTMLTKKYLYEEPAYAVYATLALVCFAVVFLVRRYKVVIAAVISIASLLAYIVLSILLFNKGIILNIVYPIVAVFITYGAAAAYSYFTEEKQKRQIHQAFSKYVSPALVQEIIKNPDKLKLGGEKRGITILFSDIRGFTTLSEALGPEKLVSFLNEYLTEMTNIVLKNKGTVDKYIGDAVMAFWGAPLDEKEQELLACKTAIEMQEKLAELRKGWKHLPSIEIGVGLNEGECIVGNMGSHERFDYTAIGDAVNLSSRLESLTKQYGVGVIVSESVHAKVQKQFVFRALDYVKVKGKKKPVKIYELVGSSATPKEKKTIATFEKAFALYLNKEFDAAVKEFSIVDDKTSHMFIERCDVLKKHVPKDWDGSFEHTSK